MTKLEGLQKLGKLEFANFFPIGENLGMRENSEWMEKETETIETMVELATKVK